LGKALAEAFGKRLSGDYGIGLTISRREVEKLLEKAKSFVSELKNYLERWMVKGKG